MTDLGFLDPGGLLALAALALPLLVHLFSRSRGRVVRVGNIALYRGSHRQRVFEARLQQWPLFLLRALLVLLAALWLAGLARTHSEELPGRTAYVTREWLAVAGRDLAEIGAYDQAYVLSEGFPAIDAVRTEPGGFRVDPWSLLTQRLTQVRHGGEVHVYALAAARQFPARAPALGTRLNWHLDDRPDAAPPSALPALDVTLRYAPDRSADARILGTALDLLAAERRVDLSWREDAIPRAPTRAGTDRRDGRRRVLISLSGDSAPADDGFDAVLRDEPATSGAADTLRLDQAPEFRFRVQPAAAAGGGVLWRTETGAPLLIARRAGGTEHLRLLDRLTARDNGLLNSEVFPDLLLRLLLGERAWATGIEAAPADPAPVVARGQREARPPLQSLAPWLALAIAVLAGLERWMSERPPRDGSP